MFRPFRKLLIKMRDYLRTLNKNELFQLEKLLCTNEEINIKQSADESTGQCCDDKTTTTTTPLTTNVTIVNNNESSTIDRNNENFYTIKTNQNNKSDEWVSEDAEGADDEAEDDENDNSEATSNYENLVTADCATGYLVPNTNLGNLLQSNAAPLTYNIVISETSENNNINEDDQNTSPNNENVANNCDSGLGTKENGSLDQSPEQEQNTNVLTGQYDENWENLRKIVDPNSNKSGSSSSHHHHRHKDHKSGKRKLRKHQSSSSDSTSSSSASSSTASSPSSSDSRDLSRRAKFK